MKDCLISIIIPIYNAEKYLNRCLESVICQSYKNLEIILVDDGSIDNSGILCDEYASKDDRIVVIHIKNSGQSVARKKGLEIAKGNYIGFVDSDDLIHVDTFKVLLEQMLLFDADLSICGYKKFSQEESEDRVCASRNDTLYNNHNVKCVNREYALGECLSTKFYTASMWAKLFKKSVLDNIDFPIGTEMEDWAVIVDIFLKCKKVVLLKDAYYYYYQRDNSTMHGDFKEKDLLLESIFVRNLDLIEQYFPSLYNQAKTNLTANYFYVIDKMIKSGVVDKYNNEFDDLVLKLRKEMVFIVFKSKHHIVRKMLYIALMLNKRFYIFLYSVLLKGFV